MLTGGSMIKMTFSTLCQAGAVAALSLGFWAVGVAQQALPTSTSDSLAEIVVTAQKREERLQDVPISIAVADEEQLERQQIYTIADLNRISPALEIVQAGGQPGGGGQIRGIGTQTFASGAVGSVGIVVDQVSQGNVNINNIFDVARVEVLKGPQGTLFGLTTSAGVINIVTNAPDPSEFSAKVHADFAAANKLGSRYGEQVIQSVVNIPLTSNSALRVAGILNFRQGVDYNVIGGKFDQMRDYNLRARYLWKPSDALSVDLIGDYDRQYNDGGDFFTVTSASAADTASLAQCGITAADGNRNFCSNYPITNPTVGYGVSGHVDYSIADQTLTSITAYRKYSTGPGTSDIFRIYTVPVQIRQSDVLTSANQFTQEFRIASPSAQRLVYTAGAFYSWQTNSSTGGGDNITLTLPDGTVIPLVPPNSGSNTFVHIQSQAVFGQTTFNVTDAFRLIGGARFTHDMLDVFQIDKNDRTLFTNPRPAVRESKFSWKFGTQYSFNRDLMAYTTISRGYKGPQVNISNIAAPAQIIRPEIPMDYEAGVKAIFFEGRLNTDLSVFYMNVRDFQGQQCIPVLPAGLACGPTNLAHIVSKGIELSIFGRPTHDLTLNGGIIYNPVKYPLVNSQGNPYASSDGTIIAGHQLGNVPKVKFTLSAEYTQPLAGGWEGFIAADTVYKSDLDLGNSADPMLHYPAHWIHNGRVGVRTPGSRLELAAFVRNAGDKHEPALIFPQFPNAADPAIPGDKTSYGTYYVPQSFRLVGVTVEARF